MSFDKTKREAIALERQLEDKVSRYQQIAQRLNKAVMSNDPEQGTVPWEEEKLLQQEISRLLTTLHEVVTVRLPSTATLASQHAVVNRYRDILLDLRADFEKSKMNVRRASERKELLGSTSASSNGFGNIDPAMDHLLRERNHINNSMNAAGNVIGQADAIRSDLRYQGRSLRNAGSLLGQLTTNIPGLNHLVEQIRRKRSRDDKIVAVVIATCIGFTLWYMLG